MLDKNKNNNDNKKTFFNVKMHTMKDDLSEKMVDAENVADKEHKSGGIEEGPFLDKGGVTKESDIKNGAEKKDAVNNESDKATLGTEKTPSLNFSDRKNDLNGNLNNGDVAIKNSVAEENKKSGSGRKKVVMVLITLVLLIAGVGIVVYYGWKNKEVIFDNPNETNQKLDENQVNSDNNNEQKNTDDQFSEDANYLMIDTSDGTLAIDTIKNTSKKIPKNKLIEFVITDKDNVELLFPEFSNSIGLSLPENIMNNIDDNFSLFLYKNNNGNARMGLVLQIKNKEKLISAISQNSNRLIEYLKPILLESSISKEREASGFNTSSYKNINIRYNNIGENSDLSLDYAVIGDKLVIATSKDMGRNIIDKLLKYKNDNDGGDENVQNDSIGGDNNDNKAKDNEVIINVK